MNAVGVCSFPNYLSRFDSPLSSWFSPLSELDASFMSIFFNAPVVEALKLAGAVAAAVSSSSLMVAAFEKLVSWPSLLAALQQLSVRVDQGKLESDNKVQ